MGLILAINDVRQLFLYAIGRYALIAIGDNGFGEEIPQGKYPFVALEIFILYSTADGGLMHLHFFCHIHHSQRLQCSIGRKEKFPLHCHNLFCRFQQSGFPSAYTLDCPFCLPQFLGNIFLGIFRRVILQNLPIGGADKQSWHQRTVDTHQKLSPSAFHKHIGYHVFHRTVIGKTAAGLWCTAANLRQGFRHFFHRYMQLLGNIGDAVFGNIRQIILHNILSCHRSAFLHELYLQTFLQISGTYAGRVKLLHMPQNFFCALLTQMVTLHGCFQGVCFQIAAFFCAFCQKTQHLFLLFAHRQKMDLEKQVFPKALGFLFAIAQVFPLLFVIHFCLVKAPVLLITFLKPFQFLQQFFVLRQNRTFF